MGTHPVCDWGMDSVCVCECHSDVKPFMCEGNGPTIFSTFNGGSVMPKCCMDHIACLHTSIIYGTWMEREGEREGRQGEGERGRDYGLV